MGSLAIIGDFEASRPTHSATEASINHVRSKFDIPIEFDWIPSSSVDTKALSDYSGVLIAPGPPYESLERVLEGIRFAREESIPLLGTCQGFQSIVLEYARNVLDIPQASHEEYQSNGSEQVITKQVCSLAGLEMQLSIDPHSELYSLYGSDRVKEKYHCNFGISPNFVHLVETSTLKVVGTDENGEIRIVQLENHPFYIGTLFVPQASSSKESPHPLIKRFLEIIHLRGNN